MTTIDDRVAAGAAWLDANRPGWWQRINLDTLDLGHPCNCVLGQTEGVSYLHSDLLAPFGEERNEVAAEMGMFAELENEMGNSRFEYAALTAAWRHLIQARRDAKPAPAVWPDRTHDGQRPRDIETADVAGEVL